MLRRRKKKIEPRVRLLSQREKKGRRKKKGDQGSPAVVLNHSNSSEKGGDQDLHRGMFFRQGPSFLQREKKKEKKGRDGGAARHHESQFDLSCFRRKGRERGKSSTFAELVDYSKATHRRGEKGKKKK